MPGILFLWKLSQGDKAEQSNDVSRQLFSSPKIKGSGTRISDVMCSDRRSIATISHRGSQAGQVKSLYKGKLKVSLPWKTG